MRKMFFAAIAMATLLFSGINVKAQTADEKPFIGKWTLTVTGIPSGDMTVPLTVAYTDGKLTGTMIVRETEIVNLQDVAVNEGVLTANIVSQGMTISYELEIDEEDPNAVFGTMMGMFTVEGTRVKENGDCKCDECNCKE